jgi:prevent-host-death family protein
MGSWQLQDAKARLSEVIATAKESGPQVITQRGVETAVVVPIDEWKKLKQEPKLSLLEALQSGPKFDIPIPPRSRWKMRKPVEF